MQQNSPRRDIPSSDKSAPFFSELVLLSGKNTYEVQLRHLEDKLPDTGPLGGLLSGLLDTNKKHEWAAFLPVDLPLITENTIQYLSEATPESATDAHITCSHDRIQPLCGIYHSSVTLKLDKYLNAGNRRVMGFIEMLQYSLLHVDNQEILNVNTLKEFKQLNGNRLQ